MEYMNEQRLVNDLRSQVFTLQQEIQTLTTSLTQAAERLQQCYKTPWLHNIILTTARLQEVLVLNFNLTHHFMHYS